MKFGCLKEKPSIRNYDFDIVCGAALSTELPKEYMLPVEMLPTVRNQGQVGACVAFACVEIMEVLNKIEFGTSKTFSAGFFYGYNRAPDEDFAGMYPERALKHFRNTGSVPTTMFDELQEMPGMRNVVKNRTDLAEIAKKYRIAGYSTICYPQIHVEKVKTALVKCNYPLLAISHEHFGGSHAIIIVGWNKRGWIIQNSWGAGWKDGGRDTVPFTAINYVYILTDEVFEMKFVDVPKDKWYYNAIKETVFNGLMKGTSEDTFDPDEPITRGEMAQICVNLCEKIDSVLKGD